MELYYNNKKSTNEILEKTTHYKQFDNIKNESCLIYGDNFNALSSLLKTHKNKIDLIYIDPPFNTNQTFKISENRKNTISKNSKGVIAYDDNMTKEDFLEFIRERLVIMKELLSENGSIYLHTNIKNGHYIKIIMDEIFGENNFKNDITRIKSNPKNFYRTTYGNEKDVIYFYAKNAKKNIWNDIRIKTEEGELIKKFPKIDKDGRRYTTIPLHAPGESYGVTGKQWNNIKPPEGRHWRTDPIKLDQLNKQGLIEWSCNNIPRMKKFADEYIGKKMQDIWKYKDPQKPSYPTEKNLKMIELIIQQSSNNDSVVLDCFCGGGTTLIAAEKLGRKWIGIDSSIVAIETIKNKKDLKSYQFYNCSIDKNV